jgi:anti-sigma regulatory factor (Ser/Thr protein kinase)
MDAGGVLLYERLLPALPMTVSQIRHELVAVLSRDGLTRRDDIELVVGEAATNVVVHAYEKDSPGPIYASATLHDRDLTLSIIDSGRGTRSPSASPGAGLGLSLFVQLSDELSICANEPDAGTSVRARFNDARPASTRRPEPTAVIERGRMLQEYLRVLDAAHASLRQETDAVLAQTSQVLAHARRCRGERGDPRRRLRR